MLNNYLNYLKSLSNIKELDYVTIKKQDFIVASKYLL